MTTAAIGIDLGTTFSALARLNEAGAPEIVNNAEGDMTTPSAVYLPKSGPIQVGESAIAALELEAARDRVFRWMKREMGNPDWGVEVDGRRHSAVDLSAMVLTKVRVDAERELGRLDRAVITVPAYFGEIQRKSTMDAARLAGLEVLRLVNEPTAAAIAYAAAGKLRGRALIYDFGGGTFDVSVVDVASPSDITVVVSEGDHRLGGYDIDLRLAQYAHEKFRARFGGPAFDDLEPQERHELVRDAEKAKINLSKSAVAGIKVAQRGSVLPVELDRATADELFTDLVTRTEMLVEAALGQSGSDPSGIDSVILVGGSTRNLAVGRLIDRLFGSPGQMTIGVDKVVALGAAIRAGMILAEQGESDLPAGVAARVGAMNLLDVANHSYGTLAVSDENGQRRLQNDILIPKNTRIPASVTKSYFTVSDGQSAVNCEVTQGEDTDPEFVTQLWVEQLDLPPGRSAGQEIKVTFAYDEDQRMSCDFLDVASGRKKHVTFDMVRSGDAGSMRSVPAAEDIDFSQLDIV